MPGEGPWDPIGFSKLHENIQGAEHAGVVPSQQWMREAEIKHGRVRYGVRLPSHLDGAKPHAINAPSPQVAMLAFTGALVQSYGMHFDGKLNGMFFEKGVNPFEATPSAFATTPWAWRRSSFSSASRRATPSRGAWSGDMKREPGDLGYRVMRVGGRRGGAARREPQRRAPRPPSIWSRRSRGRFHYSILFHAEAVPRCSAS